jgi:hypothetical protein
MSTGDWDHLIEHYAETLGVRVEDAEIELSDMEVMDWLKAQDISNLVSDITSEMTATEQSTLIRGLVFRSPRTVTQMFMDSARRTALHDLRKRALDLAREAAREEAFFTPARLRSCE